MRRSTVSNVAPKWLWRRKQVTGTELERKSRDQVWIRFTEEQIIAVLREHEAGAKAGDLARKHGISEATLYTGRPSTAAWTCRTPSVCGRWKTRTAS